MNGLSIALGIVGIVISVIFAPLYGFIPALIGLALSVVAVILGINTKKATNNAQGGAGFVCGIVGAALGAVFFIGCLACGACSESYGAWGCLGGACNAADDISTAVTDSGIEDLNKALDALKNIEF